MQRSLSHGGIVATVVALSVFASSSVLSLDKKSDAMRKMVEHGKYLVSVIGCGDCHSPKVFGPKGPSEDPSRLLSGSPASAHVPELPEGVLGPAKWGAICSNDFTIWSGPWGVSFTANLTPDVKTGLGSWNEDIFIKTIRTGKHMGEGRQILPPMPWEGFSKMTDNDLKSIFAYLQTLKPIENAVHEPIPPPGAEPPKK